MTVADMEVDAGEAAKLASLALRVEADVLLDHLEPILARGVPVASVMVDLIAPAARLIGEHWNEGGCDFVDVTMALWRLEAVAHEIAGSAPRGRQRAA